MIRRCHLLLCERHLAWMVEELTNLGFAHHVHEWALLEDPDCPGAMRIPGSPCPTPNLHNFYDDGSLVVGQWA